MCVIRSLAAALIAFAVSGAIVAQEAAVDLLAQATEQYSRERKRLIADNLQLTAQEAEQFWPLYDQFEKDLLVLTEKRRAIIATFGENYDEMTDAMAREILDERVQLEEDRAHIRKKYLPKFERILPIKKLARYYQIESKISASVDAGIAEELPLIK